MAYMAWCGEVQAGRTPTTFLLEFQFKTSSPCDGGSDIRVQSLGGPLGPRWIEVALQYVWASFGFCHFQRSKDRCWFPFVSFGSPRVMGVSFFFELVPLFAPKLAGAQ